jgi:hypothetical protein
VVNSRACRLAEMQSGGWLRLLLMGRDQGLEPGRAGDPVCMEEEMARHTTPALVGGAEGLTIVGF